MWLDPLAEQTDAPDGNLALLLALTVLLTVWGWLLYTLGVVA